LLAAGEHLDAYCRIAAAWAGRGSRAPPACVGSWRRTGDCAQRLLARLREVRRVLPSSGGKAP